MSMKMSIDCEIIYKLNEKKILKYNIEMVKLEDYTSAELKKMISSFNKLVKFSAYSKLKKGELIKMIRTHPKIKVEEGSNAVKLSIKTDEDFEKQTKVKKEKVKKEVKKEVEKLDDVKVVVAKPVEKKSERNENYVEEDENLKLYEKGEKIMTLKTYNRLVKRYEDIKVFSKQQDDLEKRLEELKPLTVTKADGTKKELKMKKKKLIVRNPGKPIMYSKAPEEKPLKLPKVKFNPKKVKYNKADNEYTYTDRFIKKIGIQVDGTDILLTEFYKDMSKKVPKKYTGAILKEILLHLINEEVLDDNDTINLNSPFLEEFDGRDPKKLLKYYESLGFKLVGKYDMKDTEDQFRMKAKVSDLL